jgi:hypothetical protein
MYSSLHDAREEDYVLSHPIIVSLLTKLPRKTEHGGLIKVSLLILADLSAPCI